MKKNPGLFLVFVILITLACNVGSSAPATAVNIPAITAPVTVAVEAPTSAPATNAATNAASATAAPPASDGIPISANGVSFVIPQGLASGANSDRVPEATEANSDPWSVAPEHEVFTLTGYTKPANSFDPVIKIYPAYKYTQANSWAAGSFNQLQKILQDPSLPLTNDNLPTVPFNGAAAQQYAAQAKLLTFNDGNGVRMISQYAQYPAPITKTDSFYHYEGVTNDGKYFVAILMPVVLPLQSTADNPSADGITYPSDMADGAGLTAYYQGITDKLNAASSDLFQPSLNLLDELVQSITVNSQ